MGLWIWAADESDISFNQYYTKYNLLHFETPKKKHVTKY